MKLRDLLPGDVFRFHGPTQRYYRPPFSSDAPFSSVGILAYTATIPKDDETVVELLWSPVQAATPPAPDMVKQPPHYTRLNPQPLDVITSWGLKFAPGNVIKYVARAGFKGGVDALEDLRKAKNYIDVMIRELESK